MSHPTADSPVTRVPWGRLLGLALLLGLLPGCDQRAAPPDAPREASLVVFAASSLRDAFTTLEATFETAHPGVSVTFNFAGTQDLRAQLEHGALADVFASADQRHMDELVRAGRAKDPVVFARNEPVLVVATEAAGALRSLADLPGATRIVLGVPDVPIGRYAVQILDRAGATLGADFSARVLARVVSRELNVRQVLTKVTLGEAQAGIVYRTDVSSAQGRVSVVTIPAQMNVVADYPVAVLVDAPHPGLARAWVDLVTSPEGQAVLARAGFVTVGPGGPP